MTSSSAINPLEILKTLGIANPTKVTTVTGGADTAIWRVENSDGKTYALRLLRSTQLSESLREVAVMQAGTMVMGAATAVISAPPPTRVDANAGAKASGRNGPPFC